MSHVGQNLVNVTNQLHWSGRFNIMPACAAKTAVVIITSDNVGNINKTSQHSRQWRRGWEFCRVWSSWAPLRAGAANDRRGSTGPGILPGRETAAAAPHPASSPRTPASASLDLHGQTGWVVVLRPTTQNGHFGDLSPNQSLGLVDKKN